MSIKHYKVEVTRTYCIDVVADDSDTAQAKAEIHLDAEMLEGTEHNLQTGDTVFQVYDVTNTDDPFDPNY